MNMILMIAMFAMLAAAIVNIILTESGRFCNFSNRDAYKEMLTAGSVLMFLGWIITSQDGAFDTKYLHIVAVIFSGVFFFDVVETFRLNGNRSGDQKMICADTKKTAVVIAVMYFIFSYLVS